jgi:hypothetical protein
MEPWPHLSAIDGEDLKTSIAPGGLVSRIIEAATGD